MSIPPQMTDSPDMSSHRIHIQVTINLSAPVCWLVTGIMAGRFSAQQQKTSTGRNDKAARRDVEL